MKTTLATDTVGHTNHSLLLPYAAPYLLYVAVASVLANRVSPEISYTIRLVTVPMVLAWAWRWYVPIRGPLSIWGSIVTGGLAGVFGLVLWIVLVTPLAPATAEPWSFTAFLLRIGASVLVVPVFEELFTRGYVLRTALQWDDARKTGSGSALEVALHERSIDDVPPGAWSIGAVVVSTLVFASGHQLHEWPAATAYGLLMASLWVIRKDLLGCMVAHGVTNLALGVYVWQFERWGLW